MPELKSDSVDKTSKELKDKELIEKAERPGNEIALISIKRTLLELLILLLAGMLFAGAFPEWDIAPFAWVGLVPLFFLVKDKRAWKAALYGLVWGYGLSVTSFFWIREISPVIPFILAFILALFPAVWAAFVPVLYRGLLIPVEVQLRGWKEVKSFNKQPRLMELLFVFATASLWCILEWVRSWIATGLPWNFLATTQWQNLSLIQICEYTGVFGVSFLVAVVNISIAVAVSGWIKGFKAHRYRRPVPLIVSLILLMVAILAGSKSLLYYGRLNKGINFTAVVVQGDIPQSRNAEQVKIIEILGKYISLTRKALNNYDKESQRTIELIRQNGNDGESLDYQTLVKIRTPDLIIWPETAVPYFYDSFPAYQDSVSKIISESGVPFLLGTIEEKQKVVADPLTGEARLIPEKTYNSAYFIDKKGYKAGTYRKSHIVPFGEFVPFRNLLPDFIVKMIDMNRDLSRGENNRPIEVAPGVRAGVNICFEDVFPYISRAHALDGANLLIVVTNDAWYPESDESEQHLANSIFRAVETRLPMIRSGNNNCSCLIAPTGKIVDSVGKTYDKKLGKEIPYPQERGEGDARFTALVEEKPTLTFYSRHGNVFILFCWLIFGFAAAWTLWSWREKKQAQSAPFK